MFQFFEPDNWEMLIKVLDGCRTNGRIWVLGAATTDLGYRIVVTDTVTPRVAVVRERVRPAGPGDRRYEGLRLALRRRRRALASSSGRLAPRSGFRRRQPEGRAPPQAADTPLSS